MVAVAEDGAESIAIVKSHACDSPRTVDKADVKVLAVEGTALSSLGVPVVVNALCLVNDLKCERRVLVSMLLIEVAEERTEDHRNPSRCAWPSKNTSRSVVNSKK